MGVAHGPGTSLLWRSILGVLYVMLASCAACCCRTLSNWLKRQSVNAVTLLALVDPDSEAAEGIKLVPAKRVRCMRQDTSHVKCLSLGKFKAGNCAIGLYAGVRLTPCVPGF